MTPLVTAVQRYRLSIPDTTIHLAEADLPRESDLHDAVAALRMLLGDAVLPRRVSVRGGIAVWTNAASGIPLLLRTGLPRRMPLLRLLGDDYRLEIAAPPVDSAEPTLVRIDDVDGERTLAAEYESAASWARRTLQRTQEHAS